jgi:hypothetical protein
VTNADHGPQPIELDLVLKIEAGLPQGQIAVDRGGERTDGLT